MQLHCAFIVREGVASGRVPFPPAAHCLCCRFEDLDLDAPSRELLHAVAAVSSPDGDIVVESRPRKWSGVCQ